MFPTSRWAADSSHIGRATVPMRLIRGTLAEERPSWVARRSTTPELKGIAWEAMGTKSPVFAMSSEDRANGKPDLGLDAWVLQAEIGAELGLSNRSSLQPVRQTKPHWLSSWMLNLPAPTATETGLQRRTAASDTPHYPRLRQGAVRMLTGHGALPYQSRSEESRDLKHLRAVRK
jgi:hypothetical protein